MSFSHNSSISSRTQIGTPSVRWENDLIINMIELHQTQECLWNPSDKRFNCRRSKDIAWRNIAEILEIDVLEVKRKMKNVIGQYFREKKKYDSLKKSLGDEQLPPKWFAYSFLNYLIHKNDYTNNTDGVIDETDETKVRL